MPNLAIIIPTYNEKENIQAITAAILAQGEKIRPYSLSVIIADSHSPDGTGEIAARLARQNSRVHLLDIQARGIGVALKQGYDYAADNLLADVIAQIDADFSHNPNDIPKFIAKIQQGFDFVQASRFIPGGKNKLEFYRDLFSRGANLLCKLTLGVKAITDFTPSFRAFKTRLCRKTNLSDIPWQGKSYIFQPAFAYALARAGAKIAEVPIIFRDREAGQSKLNATQYILDLLSFTLKIKIKRMQKSLR